MNQAPLRLAAVVVVALVNMACSQEPLPVPRQVRSQTDLEDVRAAVLLYAYHGAMRESPLDSDVTCIRVANSDPTRELLSRLSGYGLNARGASKCKIQDGRFRDVLWGTPATVCWTDRAELHEPGVATAGAGCGTAPKSGLYFWCDLDFRLGRWRVTTVLHRLQL